MEEKNLLSVGELAKRAGVTVRTLQYYDKCELLKPQLSEGGRRLYNLDDIMRLQQILFLKSFGFSLEEIRDSIIPSKSPEQLERLLIKQRQILTEQIKRLNEASDIMGRIIAEIKSGNEIGLEKFLSIMQLIQQGNPYTFVLRYLGDDQIKNLVDRFEGQDAQKFIKKSEENFAELITLYKDGADPEGEKGQKLAAKWWAMVMDFSKGDPELIGSLMSAGVDVDNWPEDTGEFKEAVKIFLEKAFSKYLKDNNIIPGDTAQTD